VSRAEQNRAGKEAREQRPEGEQKRVEGEPERGEWSRKEQKGSIRGKIVVSGGVKRRVICHGVNGKTHINGKT
jgi:hypothetical protein